MADNRPESLITTLKSIGEFALLVLGIIGIAVEVFHDQGLLKQLIDKMMNAAFSSSITVIVGAIVIIAILKFWYDAIFTKAENATALGNFLMRGMMIFGAYVLYHFLTTGSFKS